MITKSATRPGKCPRCDSTAMENDDNKKKGTKYRCDACGYRWS